MYINNCNFVGRITNRPIKLSEHKGSDRAQFTIALNKPGRDQAEYLKCVAWGERAQNIQQVLQMGQEVHVAGELSLRHFKSEEDGTDRRDIYLTIKEFSAGAQPRGAMVRPRLIQKPFSPIRVEEDIDRR